MRQQAVDAHCRVVDAVEGTQSLLSWRLGSGSASCFMEFIMERRGGRLLRRNLDCHPHGGHFDLWVSTLPSVHRLNRGGGVGSGASEEMRRTPSITITRRQPRRNSSTSPRFSRIPPASQGKIKIEVRAIIAVAVAFAEGTVGDVDPLRRRGAIRRVRQHLMH